MTARSDDLADHLKMNSTNKVSVLSSRLNYPALIQMFCKGGNLYHSVGGSSCVKDIALDSVILVFFCFFFNKCTAQTFFMTAVVGAGD